MELFSLFAKIGLDTSDYDKGIKNAKKSMDEYKSDVMKLAQEYKKQGMSMSDALKKAYSEIDKSQYDTAETSKETASSFSANWSGAASALGSALSAIGQAAAVGLGAATAAVVAFGTDAVNVGKQFDASMANVASISGATGSALNDLREKAIEMGGSTKFSATEAADAMGYMAMAGWKTEDMLGGISGIMNLAAASGTDLATTADIVTDALTAFGLSASDSGHFADVLAVASSNANTNVQMMGETFKYVAPLAGTLGLTAEDVAEAVGLMANAGIKASQAGTALRSGLTRLTKPTSDMIPLMQQLGLAVSEISAEEAEAQTKALEQSLKDKQKAYEDDYDALKESLEKQSDALKKSLESRYDAQKEAFDNEYDAAKKAYDKSYEAAKDIYEKRYDERKKSLEAEYDALEKKLDAEIDATEKAQAQTLAQVQKNQEGQVKAYQEATDAKLALIDEEYKESLRLTDEAEYNRLKDLDEQIAKIQEASDAAAKAAEDEERKQCRAELQKAINTADSAEKRREAEEKLAAYNENIRLKDEEAKRKADIADLKAQKDKIKEEAKAERDAAKEKLDADTKAYKDERAAGLEELKETNEQNLATLKERQKAELDALKDSKKAQLAALKESNAEDLKEMKNLQAEQLASIKESNDAQLKELKASQSKQLANLKDGNEERLAEVKKANEKDLKALQESNKEKLAEYQEYVTAQKKAIKDASESAQSLVLTDENGNMRSLNEAVGILREAFSGLSEAEQAEAAATIFGQEAMSGWLAMLNAAPSDIAKLEAALRDCEGAAADMAAVHEDSLAGSLTTLESALETLKIRLSDEITPALREFTEFAQNSVVALTKAFEEGDFSGMMDALGPVIEDGIGMLMGYIPKVVEVGGQLLGAVVTGIVNNLPVLAEGALTLATSFGGYLLDAFRDVFSGFGLGEQFDAVVTSVSETFVKVRDAVTGAFERIKTAFSDAFGEYFTSGQAAQDVTNLLTTAIELFGDAVSVAADIVATVVEKIIDFVKWLSEGSTGADLFTAAVAGLTAAFVAYKAAMAITGLIDGVSKAITGAKAAFAALHATMMANPFVLIATLIAGIVTALVVLWNTNEDFRNAVIQIWEGIKEGIAAAWEGIKAASAAAWDFIKGVFSGVGDFFQGVWNTISDLLTPVLDAVKAAFSLAWTVVQGVWIVATAFFGAVWDGIKAVFSVARAVIGGFFSTAWAAVKLVWNAATGYFQNIWNTVAGIFFAVESVLRGDFSAAWTAIQNVFSGWGYYFQSLWNSLTNVFANVSQWFKNVGVNIVNGIWNGITSVASEFFSNIGDFVGRIMNMFTGKSGFDEHSPSRWSEGVFQRVLEGGEIGLDKGLPAMLDSARDAVSDIQNALAADPFSASGDYQLSGGYSYAAPQLAAAGAGYAAAQPVEVTVQPSNVILNDRIMGQIVWQKVRTQLRARG